MKERSYRMILMSIIILESGEQRYIKAINNNNNSIGYWF